MKTEKDFDCVKVMRDIREKISYEIKDMNPDEIMAYVEEGRNEYQSNVHKYDKDKNK